MYILLRRPRRPGGDHAVYDLAQHIVVLTGKALKLVTTAEVITARDSLEYFEDSQTGVARGDAVAIRGDDKLTADVIAAKFTKTDATADANTNTSAKPPASSPAKSQTAGKSAAGNDAAGNDANTGRQKAEA